MLLTSQNRISVSSVRTVNQNGIVRLADVAHRHELAKHRFTGMRRMRPGTPSTPAEREYLADGQRRRDPGCRASLQGWPTLWAALALAKSARS